MHEGNGALIQEAKRQLANMGWSAYSHRTEIDEAAGIYVYDCSGFIGYSLERVLPEALDVLPRSGRYFRPLAQDYHDFIRGLSRGEEGPGGWTRIAQAAALRRATSSPGSSVQGETTTI